MIRATAVILAGGDGLRFGGNKAQAPWGSGTMLEHLIRRYGSIFPSVIVVVKDRKPYAYLARPPVEVVDDLHKEQHSMGGIHSGLFYSKIDWIFAAACDSPLPSLPLAQALWNLKGKWEAIVPMWENVPQPLFAFYSKKGMDKMRGMIDRKEFKLQALLDKMDVAILDEAQVKRFDPEGESFMDIDTKEDYERLQKRERNHAPR